MFVIPGLTKPQLIGAHRVYKFETNESWKIQLLTSLLEIRDLRWEILFDEEDGTGSLNQDDITAMVNDVATSLLVTICVISDYISWGTVSTFFNPITSHTNVH